MRRFMVRMAAVAVGMALVLSLSGSVLCSWQQAVTKVRGQEAGNAGDDNSFTFMFSEKNEPVALKKLDGTPISFEAVVNLYGKDDGMKIMVKDGEKIEDVASKYNLVPAGLDLSDKIGWPDIKIPAGILGIDPKKGRFFLGVPSYVNLEPQGNNITVTNPSNGTGIYVVDNYAYITDESTGLHIIDLATRQEIGSYKIEGTTNNVLVAGQYAYIAEGGTTPALHIVDISDPKNPFPIPNGRITMPSQGHPIRVLKRGDYVYVVAREAGVQIVKLHDEKDPLLLNPRIINSIPAGERIYGLDIMNDYLYITDTNPTYGLRIFDISSDPGHPQYVKSVTGLGKAYAIQVRQGGNYAYVVTNQGLVTVDIDKGTYGKLLRAPNSQQLQLVGDYLFFTDWNRGLKVVDVSIPENPRLVERNSSFSTGGKAMGIYVVNEHVYVLNYDDSGLKIFRAVFDSKPADATVQVDYNY